MENRIITKKSIIEFEKALYKEERSRATIKKYIHDLKEFEIWLDGAAVTKEIVSAYKEKLMSSGKAAVTVNGVLAALHAFFSFASMNECRVKYLKIQHKLFRDSSKELNQAEYVRLVDTALNMRNQRLALVLETICATGVRVSEVKYITVEAAEKGRADISLKGKVRTVLIPPRLRRKLLIYIKAHKIHTGEIFLTKNGKGLSRHQIWSEMKHLCKEAGVEEDKVFPHNLRHLFARVFYSVCKDIVCLADILGHSSIETTRIYLKSTGEEYARRIDNLGLIT